MEQTRRNANPLQGIISIVSEIICSLCAASMHTHSQTEKLY